MTTPSVETTVACKNCGNRFQGRYCNACGEKVYTERDRHVKHILEEVFQSVTNFEGTLFATLRTLLSAPGKISADYVNGVRKRYFKPLSFFLLLVVVYLLFPRFQGLNMRLQTYASDQYRYTWASIPLIKAKLQKQKIGFAELAQRYDEKSADVAQSGLLLFVPLSVLLLALLFWTSRRLVFDHFILATELCSFLVLSEFLLLPLLSFLVEKIAPVYLYLFSDDYWIWDLFHGVFVLFVTVAFRRFYNQAYWVSFLKAFAFFVGFVMFVRYVSALVIFYVTVSLV